METFNRSPRMLSPKIPPTSSEGLRPETSPSGARFSAFHPFFVWKTESLGRNHEDTRFERYTPRKTNGCNPEIKVWFQMMFPLHFAENFYRVSCSFVFFSREYLFMLVKCQVTFCENSPSSLNLQFEHPFRYEKHRKTSAKSASFILPIFLHLMTWIHPTKCWWYWKC